MIWNKIVEYTQTNEYFEGMIIEISSILLQLTIVAILVKLIWMLYNYKNNRREKYNAITIVYAIFNNFLDQLVLLFNYDEIIDNEPTDRYHTNVNKWNPVLKYYLHHLSELEPLGYENSFYYSNLKIKLFCLENSCFLKETITNDNEKLGLIKAKLLKMEEEFGDYKIFQIKNKRLLRIIDYSLSVVKAMRSKIDELLKGQADSSKVIVELHQLLLSMIMIFYDYKKFYDRYVYLEAISNYVFEPKKSEDRDAFIAKYKEIEEKKTKRNPESFLDVLYVIKASGKNKWPQYIKLLFYIPYYIIILKPYESISKFITIIIRTMAKMRKK